MTFHGMAITRRTRFPVDGSQLRSTQSKVFSNQIPLDSVESLEVITGAPPAEYGEKTSVVITCNATRSGEGVTDSQGYGHRLLWQFRYLQSRFNLALWWREVG